MGHGFPRSVTAFGLVLAIASVLVDPATIPLLASLLGTHAATKIAAVGALIAALGRAVQDTEPAPPPAAPLTEDDVP